MLSIDASNELLDFLTSQINKGIECAFPTLNIYSQGGYMGGTLLVSIPLGSPAFLKAKDGKSWANECPSTIAINEGISSEYATFNKDMRVIFWGPVGPLSDGGNLELTRQGVSAIESQRITKGMVVSIKRFYLTVN